MVLAIAVGVLCFVADRWGKKEIPLPRVRIENPLLTKITAKGSHIASIVGEKSLNGVFYALFFIPALIWHGFEKILESDWAQKEIKIGFIHVIADMFVELRPRLAR